MHVRNATYLVFWFWWIIKRIGCQWMCVVEMNTQMRLDEPRSYVYRLHWLWLKDFTAPLRWDKMGGQNLSRVSDWKSFFHFSLAWVNIFIIRQRIRSHLTHFKKEEKHKWKQEREEEKSVMKNNEENVCFFHSHHLYENVHKKRLLTNLNNNMNVRSLSIAPSSVLYVHLRESHKMCIILNCCVQFLWWKTTLVLWHSWS